MRVAPDPLPPRPPAEIRAAAEHNITVSLTPAETLGIFAELERLREVQRAAEVLLPLIEENQNREAVLRAAAALRLALPGWLDVRPGVR